MTNLTFTKLYFFIITIFIGTLCLHPYISHASDNQSKYQSLLENGTIYFESKDYTNAKIILKKAIKINPEDYRAYEKLGYIYGIEKEFNLARQNFEKAITLNTNNTETFLSLIEIYRMLGQYKKAKKLLTEIKPILMARYDQKGLKAAQAIENDLYYSMNPQQKDNSVNNITAVLLDLGYPNDIAQELSLKLLPIYKKTPFNKSFSLKDISTQLRHMVRNIQNNLIIDGPDEYSLNPKHVEIYSLLINNNYHSDFFKEFTQYYKMLSDKNKKFVDNAFKCSYKSYLGWIILTAKGFKVTPVVTVFEKSNFKNFFNKRNNTDFTREAHASLIVEVSNDQYVFVDVANSFISNTFSSEDYYCNTESSYCSFLDTTRTDVFSRVTLLDKNYLRAIIYAYLAGFYEIAGEDDKCIACLNHAIQFAPHFGYLYIQLAEFYLKHNNKEKAFENYHKAVLKNPYNDIYNYSCGAAHFDNGDYNQAIFYLETAIQYHEHPTYFYNLGVALFKEKMYTKAISKFHKIFELDKNYPNIYDALGKTYFSLGQDLYNSGNAFEAKRNFQEALKAFNAQGNKESADQVRKTLKRIYH